MKIDGEACNNIPEAVNELALSAHLSHSCELGEIIMIPLILNKGNANLGVPPCLKIDLWPMTLKIDRVPDSIKD